MSAARDRFADAVDDALDGAAQGALSSARREILAAHDAAVAEATRELREALEDALTVAACAGEGDCYDCRLAQWDELGLFCQATKSLAAARDVLKRTGGGR